MEIKLETSLDDKCCRTYDFINLRNNPMNRNRLFRAVGSSGCPVSGFEKDYFYVNSYGDVIWITNKEEALCSIQEGSMLSELKFVEVNNITLKLQLKF